MSWTCPHQRSKDEYCERLRQPCKPLCKGCVLEGKFKRVDDDVPEPVTPPTKAKPEAGASGG